MFSNSIASRYPICCSRQQICSCSYRSSTKACISFADLKPLYSNFKIHIKNYCSTLTPILHTSIYTFMCYFAETFHRHPYCYFKGHRTNFILTVHAEQLSTNFCFDQDCLYIPVLFIWSCTRTPSKSSA